MKILRTIIWVLAAIGFLVFAIYNWQPVELRLWQNLVLETKVPVLALLAFAAGFLPMWALHRSVVWGQNRRIRTLETSLKNAALVQRSDVSGGATAQMADAPVDNSGKTSGEPGDVFSPSDAAPEQAKDGGNNQ